MINIDALSLNLPAGFESRSEAIVRHVGQSLAERHYSSSLNRTSLPPIKMNVTPTQSDASVGRQIADSIHASISSTRGGRNG